MSTQTFPALPGLALNTVRTAIWSAKKQVSVAGLETALSYWSYPRWQWDLSYDVLRSAPSYTELQQLAGFFNARQGGFDSFLYQDPDDNAVSGQLLGIGTGSATQFQLARSFGGFVEPILAPVTVSTLYLNGTPATSGFTVSGWGTSTPGILTCATAPASGVTVAADFTYSFPCRFTDDKIGFTLFMSQLYAGKKISFMSLKGIA